MSEIALLIFIVSISCLTSYLLTRIKYKSAINKSKRLVDRISIYEDMTKLEYGYNAMREKGMFSSAPQIVSYLDDISSFLSFGQSGLSLVHFKAKIVDEIFFDEITSLNDKESAFLHQYIAVLDRLYKANQPLRHKILSLKKMFLMRILYLVVISIITLFETVKKCESLIRSVRPIAERLNSDFKYVQKLINM